MNLREKKILFTLINLYIMNAEPVGSRNIARQPEIDVSPATVRNTLSDLEAMGFVYQPHTSAGRIPTDKAYRFYVDRMLKMEQLRASELSKVENAITEPLNIPSPKVTDIIEHTSQVLALISRQLGVALAPRFDEGILRKLHLLPLAEGKVLGVVYLESGLVRTVVMEIESSLSVDELRRVSDLVNERLSGCSLREITESTGKFFTDIPRNDRKVMNFFIKSANRLFTYSEREQVHVGGATRMLELPEFRERDEVGALINILEDKEHISSIFRDCSDSSDEVSIMIGEENKFSALRNLSVIVSSYKLGNGRGIVGIIGPTRMRYSKIIPLVKHTAKFLSNAFDEFGDRIER